ncbi:ABC transporter ATP-binding protein [Planctobacterium marinum]|uniref:ABC transporter ATP-binding protein n=1 Tax=Planctobacterium marinum TaxID=1631968 RepID=UPI001E3039B7|nr:ABC transporter ATP-binding protein [Planctobacterium marinum]MCC2606760.1 ABC transporter ATP-binding protein [Planctobacterium marinum]
MSDHNNLLVNQVSLNIADKVILDNVSFALNRGQVLGVLGPNGAGKTSLLKVLSGQREYQGSVTWQQQAICDYSIQALSQQVAVVNQLNDMVFSLSLQHVVRMGLLPHKQLLSRHTKADDQRIQQAIQAVGLTDKVHQEFSKLSGGEQQRALIARALVQGAPLLILDEPVNHLDVYYQHQTLQLLRDLAQQLNVTVVMSLHDINLAAHYCHQLVILDNGKLVASGEPNSVLQPELLTRVFDLPCQVELQHSIPKVTFSPEGKTLLDLSRWSL